jgi:hypothetical protein
VGVTILFAARDDGVGIARIPRPSALTDTADGIRMSAAPFGSTGGAKTGESWESFMRFERDKKSGFKDGTPWFGAHYLLGKVMRAP